MIWISINVKDEFHLFGVSNPKGQVIKVEEFSCRRLVFFPIKIVTDKEKINNSSSKRLQSIDVLEILNDDKNSYFRAFIGVRRLHVDQGERDWYRN